MTNTASAARVETSRALMDGDVITQAGTDYYAYSGHQGTMELIRLHALKDGFTPNASSYRAPARRATEDERCRVMTMKLEQLNAEALYRPGALVRPVKASKHANPNALYVILKANAKTVSFTEIGGNPNGAHLNGPRSLLAIVDPADALK